MKEFRMPEWGQNIVEKTIGTYKVKIYEPRPHTILAILQEAAKFGNREFMVFDERRISFDTFIAATQAGAARFRAEGVEPGQVVLLSAANSPEFVLAMWSLLRIGAVVGQANAWWSGDEVADAARMIGARVIVADAKRRALISGDTRFAEASVIPLDAFSTYFDEPAEAGPIADTVEDEEAPAILIFTSGTTGKPKAAVLSHRAVISVLHNIYLHRGRAPNEISASEPQLSLFCCTPLFHVGGVLLQAQALLSGHRLVILKGRADGARMIDIIERERIKIWSSVPTLLARVLEHPNLPLHDVSSIISIGASGSMVSPELIAKARKAFPSARLAAGTTYGMTESGGSVTMISGEDYLKRPTSAGRPFPTCEIRILDPAPSGEGEILIRTPSAMSGFWGTQEYEMIDRNGWIHSGDLGRLDADGHLHVTGRSKDIIIRGGENLAASVVEDLLCEHPGVAEAAVVGLPHPSLGEEVGAAVLPRPGASLSPADLADFVGRRLAYFQVPSRWWIRAEPLPTNAVGKVVKTALRSTWPDNA
jgi:long-chain acyl-CoA synthetase